MLGGRAAVREGLEPGARERPRGCVGGEGVGFEGVPGVRVALAMVVERRGGGKGVARQVATRKARGWPVVPTFALASAEESQGHEGGAHGFRRVYLLARLQFEGRQP